MINDNKQNLLYAAIILVISIVFYVLSPSPGQEAHGIFLPNGARTYAATDPNSIQLYPSMPKRAIALGNVRVMKHFDSISQSEDLNNQTAVIQFAQSLASEVGANGLVITILGRNPQAGPLDGFVLYAQAIRTS
ncbi:MAG: hypothetical protein K0R66_1459 [Gammaproteobacteria bacterium]|jgi:hypothetical protein|nr:hypothetical protein [Gammaproteobacteria bacterium]